MIVRVALYALFMVAAAIAQTSQPSTSATAPTTPKPAARQLEWQRLELIGFVHFGMNTFTDREWGDGREDPKLFNPTDFDAAQWVAAMKAAGIRKIIITAKHHDGFCLWPTKLTEHCVRSSPWRDGKGDVVGDLAKACRDAGLRFGVYLSPWDRHEPAYGDSPKYNAFYVAQLTELLTTYAPVHEVWFDGACGEGPNGRKQVYDWPAFHATVRRLAPDAVMFSDAGPDVRWVGNEKGFAGETNWSTLRRDECFPGMPNYEQLQFGHEDGTHWVPAECDVSIRPGWFHHAAEDDKVKTLAHLLDIYYGSVGRNGVLLLNVPPDKRGRIHDNDVARLAEFGGVVASTFAENLARSARLHADGLDPVGARRLIDGDYATSREFPAAPAIITVDLPGPTRFNRVALQEDVREGQSARAFSVEAETNDQWREIASGTTIGYKRLLRVDTIQASRVRIVVRDARGPVRISEIGLYLATREPPAP